MSDEAILRWLPYAFPFFFLGMWLVVTTMLGFMSGWFNLQQWYPDEASEDPLLELRGQSGRMGVGVSMGRVLRLRAYPSGLGIGIRRVFGPFMKPLRIPWSEIEAEPKRNFFQSMMKLSLGKPTNGTLTINARSWSRLVDALPQTEAAALFKMPAGTSVRSGARPLIFQWLAISAFAGAFFYFTSRSARGAVPMGLTIIAPLIVFGIVQLVRYARES